MGIIIINAIFVIYMVLFFIALIIKFLDDK